MLGHKLGTMEIFKEGMYVKCKRNNSIRYVSALIKNNKQCFEDDGKVSKQIPSNSCYFENYLPMTIQEYGDFVYNQNFKL